MDKNHEPEGPSLPLCPNCLTQNEPDADFCRRCGCPLSTMAATDPLRQVYSQGFWFGRAASGRIPPIVFWGTWLVFGPWLLIFLILIVAAVVRTVIVMTAPANLMRIVVLSAIIALWALCFLFLCRMTRNYLRLRRTHRNPAAPPGRTPHD